MTTHAYYVTLLWRGSEITVEVRASSKELARREARALHPGGHLLHVEPVAGSARHD